MSKSDHYDLLSTFLVASSSAENNVTILLLEKWLKTIFIANLCNVMTIPKQRHISNIFGK